MRGGVEPIARRGRHRRRARSGPGANGGRELPSLARVAGGGASAAALSAAAAAAAATLSLPPPAPSVSRPPPPRQASARPPPSLRDATGASRTACGGGTRAVVARRRGNRGDAIALRPQTFPSRDYVNARSGRRRVQRRDAANPRRAHVEATTEAEDRSDRDAHRREDATSPSRSPRARAVAREMNAHDVGDADARRTPVGAGSTPRSRRGHRRHMHQPNWVCVVSRATAGRIADASSSSSSRVSSRPASSSERVPNEAADAFAAGDPALRDADHVGALTARRARPSRVSTRGLPAPRSDAVARRPQRPSRPRRDPPASCSGAGPPRRRPLGGGVHDVLVVEAEPPPARAKTES